MEHVELETANTDLLDCELLSAIETDKDVRLYYGDYAYVIARYVDIENA